MEKRRRETQKEFRRLVLGEFFLAKGEENEKMNNTLLFSVKKQSLETRKLRKLLTKEEEEEVQEDVQRDSKVFLKVTTIPMVFLDQT